MEDSQLKSIAREIKKLGETIRKSLGCGFQEHIYQAALAIEFRRHKIEYLKEVNIEIFYRGESVGADRPDFIITKIGNYRKPILLELKAADSLSPGHKRQLRSYCISLPKNKNPVLKNFAGGILMAFPQGEIEEDERQEVKIFCVDNKFRTLIDDEAEEETKKEKL